MGASGGFLSSPLAGGITGGLLGGPMGVLAGIGGSLLFNEIMAGSQVPKNAETPFLNTVQQQSQGMGQISSALKETELTADSEAGVIQALDATGEALGKTPSEEPISNFVGAGFGGIREDGQFGSPGIPDFSTAPLGVDLPSVDDNFNTRQSKVLQKLLA